MNIDTSHVKESIYSYLKEGLSRKDAAVMAGISEATFYRWIKEDESFESSVEASILEYKRTLIKNVTACAEKDGKLALEVLKRRFPSEWGDKALFEKHEGLLNERTSVAVLLQKIYDNDNHDKQTQESSDLVQAPAVR